MDPNQRMNILRKENKCKCQATSGERGTYKCSFCGFRTFRVNLLQIHEALHTKRSRHQCVKCSYSVMQKKHLKNHLMSHHLDLQNNQNPESSQGQEASVVTPYNAEGFQRNKIPRKRKWYKCAMHCNYRTKNSFNMKLHKNGHQRNQKFKCTQCSYSSNREFFVIRHLRLYHIHPLALAADSPSYFQTNAVIGNTSSSNENESGKIGDNNTANHPFSSESEVLSSNDPCLPSTIKADQILLDDKSINDDDVIRQLRKRKMYSCTYCNYKSRWIHRCKTHSCKKRKKKSSTYQRRFYAICNSRGNVAQHSKLNEKVKELNVGQLPVSLMLKANLYKRHNVSWKFSSSIENPRAHQTGHQKDVDFKCHRCTFSSRDKNIMTCHMKYHHRRENYKNVELVIPDTSDTVIDKGVENMKASLLESLEKGETIITDDDDMPNLCMSEDSDVEVSRSRIAVPVDSQIACAVFQDNCKRQKEEFKCNFCNYKSSLNFALNRHLKLHHQQQNSTKDTASIADRQHDSDDEKLEEIIGKMTHSNSLQAANTRDENNCLEVVQYHVNEELSKNDIDINILNEEAIRGKAASIDTEITTIANKMIKGISTLSGDRYEQNQVLFQLDTALHEIKMPERESIINKEIQTDVSSFLSECYQVAVADQEIGANDDADYYRKLNEFKEENRLLRCSIDNIRKEVKQQQEFKAEKTKSKQLLEAQLVIQKEEIKAIDEKLTDFSLKKNQVQKEIKEIFTRKLYTEIDLRTLECKDLQLKIAALGDGIDHEYHPDMSESNEASRRERIELSLNEIKNMDNELRILKEEAESHIKNLEDGRRSAMEAAGKLNAIQSKLEELASNFDLCANCSNNESFFNRLIALTEEKVPE